MSKENIVLGITLTITVIILVISSIHINKNKVKTSNIYSKQIRSFQSSFSKEHVNKIQNPIIENENGIHYRVPAFLIIGASRSGTVSLVNMLRSHPKIHSTQKKELHFFDWGIHDGITTTNYYNYYQSLSVPIPSNGLTSQMLFDGTNNYLTYSKVVVEIKKICPWVKIIVLLRNPIDRLVSQYLSENKNGKYKDLNDFIKDDWRDLIDLGLVSGSSSSKVNVTNSDAWRNYLQKRWLGHAYGLMSISRGLYSLQLRQYFEAGFSRSQFLVLNFDEFIKYTSEHDGYQIVFDKCTKFLGIQSRYASDNRHRVKVDDAAIRNKYREDENLISSDLRESLRKVYQPYVDDLATLLGPEWKNVWRN